MSESDYTGTASFVMLADRSMSRVEDAIIHVDIPGHTGLLKVSVMPKLVSDLIIGNDWQTSIRQPVMTAETDEDEFVGELSQLIIVNSANHLPGINDAVNKSTAVPSAEIGDYTVVKQTVCSISVSMFIVYSLHMRCSSKLGSWTAVVCCIHRPDGQHS